jgi:type II secretory pathway component PulM
MMPDTFEERQAYIEKCEQEMREAVAKHERSKAHYESINRAIQTALMQHSLAMTSLIYNAMFNPNFGKPQSDAEKKP